MSDSFQRGMEAFKKNDFDRAIADSASKLKDLALEALAEHRSGLCSHTRSPSQDQQMTRGRIGILPHRRNTPV